jgi:hypothetical protein
MGCSRLLEKPWGFKDDRIVRELLDGVSNEFDNSIRATPTRWTEECWREVYNFSTGGGGLAGREKLVRERGAGSGEQGFHLQFFWNFDDHGEADLLLWLINVWTFIKYWR